MLGAALPNAEVGAKKRNRPAKVAICHRTGNGKFVLIEVAKPAAEGGHSGHDGDIIPAPVDGDGKAFCPDDPCAGCTSCQDCIDGQCVDKKCPGGKTCDPATGNCQDTDECDNCTSCQVCTNGRCVDKCPPGRICDPTTGTCSQPAPCDPACEAGSTCLNGECCPNGRICGGVCLSTPCDRTTCQVCDSSTGTCVSRCEDDQTCESGVCTGGGGGGGVCAGDGETCSNTISCCDGFTCDSGTCVGSLQIGDDCTDTAECSGNLRCCGGARGGGAVCSRLVCKQGFRPQGGFPNGPRCECCGGGICSTRFIKRLVQK